VFGPAFTANGDPLAERVLRVDLSALPVADVYGVQMPRPPMMHGEVGFRVVFDIARRHGARVQVEVDDWVDFPEWHPAYGRRGAWKSYLNRCVRDADVVTVSTPFLLEKYGRLNGNVRLIRNYLEREMWRDVPMMYEVERRRVRVGWFGAASMRSKDLEVLSWLPGWLARHPEVEFVAAGSPLVHDVLGVPQRQRVSLGAVPILVNGAFMMPSIVASMDIGLVPLHMCDFNEAKSHLKGLEYNACGIPFVASPTESYRWYTGDDNGFVASTPEEWMRCLDLLVGDDGFRRQLGCSARRRAEENWIEADEHIGQWHDAYLGVGDHANVAGAGAVA
jgi:glycosyltransferase involved in cell wall biosynthesis